MNLPCAPPILGITLACGALCAAAQPAQLSAPAQAGREVFFDTRLSNPPGTACVSCHNPLLGWSGNNRSASGVAAGSRPDTLGARNSPTLSYVGFTPRFHLAREKGKTKALGGLFWDGRADTLEEQARGPLFTAVEMNLASETELAERLRSGPYAARLRAAFGLADSASDGQWTQAALSAVAAFQRSPELAPFSSKYDAVRRGEARFSRTEARGLRWFSDPASGNCVACHVFKKGSKNPADHLFTDFSYDNLGLPRNPAIPANAKADHFDLGLCGPSRERPETLPEAACGGFKVPTLRNVAQRPFYFHNGSFTDLTQAVRFYFQRDTLPAKWYPRAANRKVALFNDLPARYRRHVNRDEVPYDRRPGQAPRLNDAQIADLVSFLKALDDGYTPGKLLPGNRPDPAMSRQ